MIRFSLNILFVFLLLSIKANAVENVNTQTLANLISYQQHQFPATVIPLTTVTLSSQITGNILSDTFFVGTNVLKDQTLVRIDCRDNELAKTQAVAVLKRLQIQLKLNQQQLKRAQKLVRVKSISKQEYDQKQTDLDADIASLEQQQAALNIIDHNMTKCIIKAPFTGVISENIAQKGSFASPGTPLLTLMDPSAVEIEVALPLKLASNLSLIETINFQQNNHAYSLKIRSLLPFIDPVTKQQKIRLSINTVNKPLANSTGLLQWKSHQPYIDQQYLVQRNGQLGIFIAESNKAVFKQLEHAIEGQKSPINLSPNTLVIINKLLLLNNNDKIN